MVNGKELLYTTLFLTIKSIVRQPRQSLMGDTQVVQHTPSPPSPHPLTAAWPLYLWRVHEIAFCIVLCLKPEEKSKKA